PYIQSQRKEMYRPYAEQLVQNGAAYYAFDTADELEAMREKAKQMGMPNWQYNAVTRSSMKNSLSLSKDEVEKRLADGEPYTIRMKMPRNRDIKFEDIIRGWITVNTNNLDDKVLFKESGMPTYHLANIVDDHLMEITHVIRGEEWLPSAPLHVLLYEGFGWERPQFAHLPLILRPDGNGKLSKRDGDRLGFPVFPIDWHNPDGEKYSGYRENGYYPEAFINMLALLGWNPGNNKEIFTLDELVSEFSLERVGKSGSRFDPEKTRWFNQQYLRAKTNEELSKELGSILLRNNVNKDSAYVSEVCALMKERATFVTDIYQEGSFFFEEVVSYDQTVIEKKWNDETTKIMGELLTELKSLSDFTATSIETKFTAYLEQNKYGFGKVGPGFRLLVTGKGMGPSMFAICALLGKETVIARMEKGLEKVIQLKAAQA
ncbi:MAG: glutamate--tRNA ligase, partial [Crocinitomicaceae bacterium]|nr:glutamate--tRNA ligase [Crocinitomicaceae bacterium]